MLEVLLAKKVKLETSIQVNSSYKELMELAVKSYKHLGLGTFRLFSSFFQGLV